MHAMLKLAEYCMHIYIISYFIPKLKFSKYSIILIVYSIRYITNCTSEFLVNCLWFIIYVYRAHDLKKIVLCSKSYIIIVKLHKIHFVDSTAFKKFIKTVRSIMIQSLFKIVLYTMINLSWNEPGMRKKTLAFLYNFGKQSIKQCKSIKRHKPFFVFFCLYQNICLEL